MLELMVVLAIVAILAAIAVPSFLGLLQTNRVASEVNALVGDLRYARSEAIKRGQPVTVCISKDGLTCTTGTTRWNLGWVVFSDANGDAAVSAGDTRLKVQPPWTNSDTFTADKSIAAITYSRDGFAIALPGPVTVTLATTPANASAKRCVAVNIAGRQTVQTPGTGTCS